MFSIEYDYVDTETLAVDWNFYVPNEWSRSSKDSYQAPKWENDGSIDESAYDAILSRFGLSPHREQLPISYVRRLNPATLAYMGGIELDDFFRRKDIGEIQLTGIPSDFQRMRADHVATTDKNVTDFLQSSNAELIKYLGKHPEFVYEVAPRKFEEIIADIFKNMGADVRLTPPTKDGGRDVLVTIHTPFGSLLSVIECKRYAFLNKVGEPILRSLMYVMDREDLASHAMLVTTSYFTHEAVNFAKKYKWRLSLKDFDDLQEWFLKYGHWDHIENSGIWLPRRTGHISN